MEEPEAGTVWSCYAHVLDAIVLGYLWQVPSGHQCWRRGSR
jgi:hypothetical protein